MLAFTALRESRRCNAKPSPEKPCHYPPMKWQHTVHQTVAIQDSNSMIYPAYKLGNKFLPFSILTAAIQILSHRTHCSHIPLPESIALATNAEPESQEEIKKKKKRVGEQSMELCCSSVTWLMLSSISHGSSFQSELGFSQCYRKFLCAQLTSKPLFLILRFCPTLTFFSAARILINTKLTSMPLFSQYYFMQCPSEIQERYATLNISGEEGIFVAGQKITKV